ncbi:MAG TPA: hypothetical protein VE650_11995 [Acetobacteraceae bacterium]|nr:hypothetical protein [Acetobacteraceae bacterium]
MTTRRGLFQYGAALLASRSARAAVAVSAKPASGRFSPDAFGTVGVFGVDWLLDPRFTRMLDQIAASPGAVRGVRAFGCLTLGPDKTFPTVTGRVWDDPALPIDFSRTLLALDALVSRDLVPFLPLTFFPPAVSPVPTQPPPDWTRWRALVRGFVDACVRRFGAAEVGRWWFEAWNEPNMPPFWRGSFDQYLDLYRATSETVRASGHRIRLGGPALAYTQGEGPALMERFLRALAAEPDLKCDFISLHRKGVWTDEEREPQLGRLLEAAEATAEAVLRILPGRARGLAIVNNEADMRVGFDRPYPPRMTAQFPSWLAQVAIAHDALGARYAAHGLRFLAAADNANQQLAQGPFDGRRSLMTRLGAPEDQVKLPVYAFYELLRLMQPVRAGPAAGLPDGVSHLLTAGEHGIAALLTRYGDGDPVTFDYVVRDIPWRRVNAVTFCIDAAHTNPQEAWPDPARMRQQAELGTLGPLRSGIAPADSTLQQRLELGPFATLLFWVTPFRPTVPPPPRWLEARREGANVVLRWTADRTPAFYSYQVRRDGRAITPMPLRSAMWIDTAAPRSPRRYEVVAISASGRSSAPVAATPFDKT